MSIYKIPSLAFVALLAFLPACQEQGNTSDEATTNETHTGHIHLTQAQQELAGIELGPASQTTVAGSIGCTALVDVPPYSLASVYSPVSGIVQSVKHLPGEYVKKGSVLTRIQHPDIVKLQQDFIESYSQLQFLEQDTERKKTLAAADATSSRSAEEAQAALGRVQAQLKGLRSQLNLLGINAQALTEGGEISPSITLRAPISGYLTEVNLNQGQLVSPTDLLYEIIDNTHKHLELSVFTKDLPRVKEHQRIEAYLPGVEEPFLAEVHLIGKRVDEENRSVQVHGHFIDEPLKLLPGTYLQARIFTDEQMGWAVPETAVVQQGAESYVFAQVKDGFEPIAVETSRSNDSLMIIHNAERIQDKTLVLRGAYYLQDTGEAGHSH